VPRSIDVLVLMMPSNAAASSIDDCDAFRSTSPVMFDAFSAATSDRLRLENMLGNGVSRSEHRFRPGLKRARCRMNREATPRGPGVRSWLNEVSILWA
jgi:hypothetical protein